MEKKLSHSSQIKTVMILDLERMQRLTQGMKSIKSGNTDSEISEDEAANLNYEGVRQHNAGNYVKANELYLKAAKAGNAWAMRNLAYNYQTGKGIHEDQQEAFHWFKKAAKLGNVDAMFETCVYYWRGEVTPKDPVKAFSWCKKAAENGHVNAMSWTGEFYRDGNGVMQNINKALEWFKKSYDGGNYYAPENIAGIYHYGTGGVPVNHQSAIVWYKRAAELGNASAMNTLGIAYHDGKIVERNFDQAEFWYKKAIEAGNENAKENLKILKNDRNSDCFITAAIYKSFGKPDDCYELTTFRNFRDNWLFNQPDGKTLIKEYYNIAPIIVAKINALSDSAEIYKNLWRDYLAACLKSIEVGDNFTCKKIYVDMVHTLKEKFLK